MYFTNLEEEATIQFEEIRCSVVLAPFLSMLAYQHTFDIPV